MSASTLRHAHSFSSFTNTSPQTGRDRAGGFIDRLEASCLSLGTFPEMGRKAEDLGPDLRLHPFERRAVIIYRVTPEAVEILGIYYGGRNLAALSEPPAGE